MTKADLKDGMVVKIRNGSAYLVWGSRLLRFRGHVDLNDYGNDLISNRDRDYDIMKVYDALSSKVLTLDFELEIIYGRLGQPIWERKEETIMTISEIEEKLGIKNLKIVGEN